MAPKHMIDKGLSTFKQEFGRNPTVQTLTGLNWAHIDLRNDDFFMDKRVRQALDLAIPREQIITKLLKGLAEPAIGDQSPSTPYFNPNIKPRSYNLDKAAALLAEAGFAKNGTGVLEKDGKPLSIEFYSVAGSEQDKQVRQVIAENWRKLGVEVNEDEQAANVAATADGFLFKKGMIAGLYEWFNAPDPENMFFWHSTFIPKGAGGTGGNYPAINNLYEQQPRFDELTAAAVKETNPEKRKQI